MLPWQDIHGWLTDEEGEALQRLAAGRIVLEIGSWRGRSTVCLAQVATRVYALDWHRGDADTGAAWTLPDCAANLFRRGLENRVVLLVGRTADVAPLLRNGLCDMVFVDGGHDRETVAADLRLALRAVRPGGVLALHDWGHTGVRAAVADELGGLAPDGTAGSLAWFILPPAPCPG